MAKLYGEISYFDNSVMEEALEILGVDFKPKAKTAKGAKKELAQKLADTIAEIKKTKKFKGNPIETYDCGYCDAVIPDVENCPFCGTPVEEEDYTSDTMSLQDFVELLDGGDKEEEKPKRRRRGTKAKAKPEPEPEEEVIEDDDEEEEIIEEDEEVEEKPKRRGRKTQTQKAEPKTRKTQPKENTPVKQQKVKGKLIINGVEVPFEGVIE